MKLSEHRVIVLTHLQYIKERVDANYDHLEKLNGRVTKNEKLISWIVGIGSSLAFVATIALTYLGLK